MPRTSGGAVGPQGPQGGLGSQGFQGFQGFQGSQGFQGLQGFQGSQGFQGNQGNQGIQGGFPTTVQSGSIGSNVSIAANATTKIFDTASLGVGTWLVTMGCTYIEPGTGTGVIEFQGIVDSATGTITGHSSCGIAVITALNSDEVCIELTFIAIISNAGTLQLSAHNNLSAAGSALSASESNGFINATGYTATKVA